MSKKPCVNCEKEFSEKMRYCPFCGMENKKEIINNIPICPKCKCALENHMFRKTDLDICPKCKGVWLDSLDFNKLTSERDVYDDDSIPFEYNRKALSTDTSYIPCPRCNALMHRQNFRRISGVLIDICKDHGAWLDYGELEQIRCFVANGGLDKSQDKEIEKNRGEIEHIAGKVRDLELMEKIMHKWNVKRWFMSGF